MNAPEVSLFLISFLLSKRLLIITKNFPPSICGVGDHTHHLANNLQQRGWLVEILHSNRETTNANKKEAHNWLPTAEEIIRKLEEHKIEKVLWQYTPGAFNVLGSPTALLSVVRKLRSNNIAQYVFFHEVALRPFGFGLKQAARGMLQLLVARKINKMATASCTSIELYKSYFKTKQPKLIPISSNILSANGQLFVYENTTPSIFCFSNRFKPIVQAAIENLMLRYNFRFHLAGKTTKQHASHIKDWVASLPGKNPVFYSGAVDAESLASIINCCDFAIQLEETVAGEMGGISAKNGTAAALFYFGKPIITNRGDMTNNVMFKHNHNVFFVDNNRVEAWEAAIEGWLSIGKSLMKNLQQNAKETSEQFLDWRVTVQKMEEILMSEK